MTSPAPLSQSVRDSLADAETLLRNWPLRGLGKEAWWAGMLCLSAVCDPALGVVSAKSSPSARGRMGARAAFRAVPSLRGPDYSAACTRWAFGPDRCVRKFGHAGPCESESGETTLSLAAGVLRG